VDTAGPAADLVGAAATLRDQSPLPPCQALHDVCSAEYRELVGGPDPEPWHRLATRLQAGGRDGLTPYVLYREATARLATEGRAAAVAPMRDAWGLAGDVRLRENLAALARTCRVDLGDGAGTAAAAPAPLPFGLTPREAEVLDRLCEGATNRQIARDLGVSERTAAVHVSHILAKLSARNRAEAIATAHRTAAVRTP
jgi:DNA-binding CsgD family transcriptional regulator